MRRLSAPNAIEVAAFDGLYIPAHGRIRRRRGLVLPYSLKRVMRGFGKCVYGRRKHPALDIGGVGKWKGLGTPVRSMVRAKVTRIGRPADDPEKFGTPDKRRGTVTRSRVTLPRSLRLPKYGRVHFFTKDHGKWRTGAMVVTRVLRGRLKNYVIRYMHLGAVHPKLKVGSIVQAGQEIGVMGGTAVMESWPHVHIDVETPTCKRVDVAWLLGLGPRTSASCPQWKGRKGKKRRKKRKKKRCRHAR
jgi:murein DD-endopeptidase MepM/ murein hydrolase activator NlpD